MANTPFSTMANKAYLPWQISLTYHGKYVLFTMAHKPLFTMAYKSLCTMTYIALFTLANKPYLPWQISRILPWQINLIYHGI